MCIGLSSRASLVLLNGAFFILGCGVLSMGLWSQYDKNFAVLWNSLEISKTIDARGLNGASLLLIISGISSIIISFVGLYGALKKERCFLTTYCLLMCVILVLEVAAASVFVAYQNEASQNLKQGLNETVNHINNDSNDKIAINVMNTIQSVFKCCGCDGPKDYANITIMQTCETNNSTKLNPIYYQNGCYQTIMDYINSHLPVLLGVAISLIVFQIFCLVISIRVCLNIRYDGYEDI
jgi:hypothetical protein